METNAREAAKEIYRSVEDKRKEAHQELNLNKLHLDVIKTDIESGILKHALVERREAMFGTILTNNANSMHQLNRLASENVELAEGLDSEIKDLREKLFKDTLTMMNARLDINKKLLEDKPENA